MYETVFVGSCDKGSVKSEQSEGPPSGKSIDKAEGLLTRSLLIVL